tara:strand:- start:266 stop:448 length:183 start_codon:yes stop_codon:yes gene_type:complete
MKKDQIIRNVILYAFVSFLFTIFTLGVGGGITSEGIDRAALCIVGGFWGIICLPVLGSEK